MTPHYPNLGSASDWLKICFIQSEALPRSEQWPVISMEFLRSFLRSHFAGKPPMASQNAGCFLRISSIMSLFLQNSKRNAWSQLKRGRHVPDIDLGCLFSLSYFRILSERIDTLYIILCVLWLWYDTSTVPGGGGGTPYNGPYGEAPPERSTFFQASDIWKGRHFISRVIWKGTEISFPAVKRRKRANRSILWLRKSWKALWCCGLFIYLKCYVGNLLEDG